MVDETITTSTQGVGQSTGGQTNPLDLVNEKTTQSNNQLGTIGNKGVLGKLISFIAKITGNPDPFTGKKDVLTVDGTEMKQAVSSQTSPEAGGLFGKFTSTLENIGNTVETLGNKAVGEATNVMSKGLETAGRVGEKAVNSATNVVEQGLETAGKAGDAMINTAQEAAKKTTDNVNEFAKLDGSKNTEEGSIPAN